MLGSALFELHNSPANLPVGDRDDGIDRAGRPMARVLEKPNDAGQHVRIFIWPAGFHGPSCFVLPLHYRLLAGSPCSSVYVFESSGAYFAITASAERSPSTAALTMPPA